MLLIEKYEFTYEDYLNYCDSLYCHASEKLLCVCEESTPYTLDENKQNTGDIVYKIKGEEIYFLVEHQTKVDYSMPYRILNYCVEIIRSAVEEQKLNKATYKYPKVVPIVLYTGNAKGKASNSFAMSQIHKEGYEDEIIDLNYKLIDVNMYEVETLLQYKTLLGNVMILEKCEKSEDAINCLRRIIKKSKSNDIEKLYNTRKNRCRI